MHVGHIEYLEKSKKQGDYLVVIVNTDEQAKLKKGKSFMGEQDRCRIIFSLGVVDEVILSSDTDLTVCQSLEQVVQFHDNADAQPSGYKEFIFCQGGDRDWSEVPEFEVCEKLGIQMVDGMGEKIRSSRDYTGLK